MRIRSVALIALMLGGCSGGAGHTAEPAPPAGRTGLQSPQDFFGHRMGEDRKLARWDRIVEYFRHLDQHSDRLSLMDLGTSTLGKPFVMAAISTAENLKDCMKHCEGARDLASGAGDEGAARVLAREGKAIVLFTCNLHSSEIGSSQTAPELAYELVRGRMPLDDVIVLVMPSINPDGQEMVVDWYRKHVGTTWEGGPMPWLYHVYAGHDNNRDFTFHNLEETQRVSQVYYKTWFPQVVIDHHQMGSAGARIFVPPYDDPVSPTLDPLLTRWVNVFGTHAALDLQAAGRQGVTHQDTFSSYWIGGAMRTPWWHNRVGLLTETASCRIATPLTLDASEGTDRKVRVVTPDPWPGGTWRLRDIVDYQLDCSWSMLGTAIRHKEDLLLDSWRMARRGIEAGKAAGEELHVSGTDRGALTELSRILGHLGVEHRLDSSGLHAPLARPYARILLELFGKQDYPAGDKPYDVTAWTLSWLLGLKHEVRKAPCGRAPVETPSASGLDPADSDSVRKANLLLRGKGRIYRTQEGEFSEELSAVSRWEVSRPRVGLYKPWTASMDEGWTRLVLERFDFSPVSLDNRRVKEGSLRDEFDCILLPDLSPESIVDGRSDRGTPEVLPPEYQGGIGTAGVAAIKAFVESGGTLICLDDASDFAIEKFGLPVKNVLKGDKEFSCPGTILRAKVERSHPLALGMPEETMLFFTNSPAFQTSPPSRVDIGREVVVRYDEKASPLASGFLNQPEKLQGRSALVDVAWGKGRIVLFGFRPQHRGQTWGTFKFLFNAIFRSSTKVRG